MSCDNINDCVYVDSTLSTKFSNINSIVYFGINLVLYGLYAFLLVFIVFNIFKAITNVIKTPGEESMKHLQSGISGAVYAAIGIVVLLGIVFFIKVAFRLIGITDDNNVFINIPTPQ